MHLDSTRPVRLLHNSNWLLIWETRQLVTFHTQLNRFPRPNQLWILWLTLRKACILYDFCKTCRYQNSIALGGSFFGTSSLQKPWMLVPPNRSTIREHTRIRLSGWAIAHGKTKHQRLPARMLIKFPVAPQIYCQCNLKSFNKGLICMTLKIDKSLTRQIVYITFSTNCGILDFPYCTRVDVKRTLYV